MNISSEAPEGTNPAYVLMLDSPPVLSEKFLFLEATKLGLICSAALGSQHHLFLPSLLPCFHVSSFSQHTFESLLCDRQWLEELEM